MLLVFDIGNSNIAVGLFDGRRLVKKAKFSSTQYVIPVWCKRESIKNIIDGVCIASVVPKLTKLVEGACMRALKIRPLVVTPLMIGMPIKKYSTREIGIDRLVSAFAAYNKYKRAVIIIDAGSAITIDAVNAKGVYLGGVIVPGVKMAANALHKMTAKLPLISISKPRRAIGTSTKECVCSGIYFGWAGLVDNLVEKISREMKAKPIVIATGGDAKLLARESKVIKYVDPDLLLKGLRLVWEIKNNDTKNTKDILRQLWE